MLSADLTARWIGHYEQRDLAFPITAELTQTGDRLSGFMRDGEPEHEYSLYEATAAAGLPPGTDERIDANIRALVPDAGAQPIRWVSHLPTDSVLAGKLIGRTVSFVKTYQGTSFNGYRVGDKLLGEENPGHAVHYEGQLSSDGRRIQGKWWIDANPKANVRRTEGSFSLRRG